MEWTQNLRHARRDPDVHPAGARVVAEVSLPPTLDQAAQEIPASSEARLPRVAGSQMKLSRRFAGERAMRTNVAIVSTPRLAFLPRLVEPEELFRVQTLGSELTGGTIRYRRSPSEGN